MMYPSSDAAAPVLKRYVNTCHSIRIRLSPRLRLEGVDHEIFVNSLQFCLGEQTEVTRYSGLYCFGLVSCPSCDCGRLLLSF